MSNKFEELLDLLVNEEMDKANELFHEIVVEKSREIYENMIAEEAEDDEEDEDDAVEEAMDDEDDMEESIEEETTLEIGGDASDDFVSDVQDDDAMGMDSDMAGDLGDEGEGSEEERIADLEDALEQLKAEFEQLMAGEENEPEHDDMEMDDEEGEDDMDDEESDDEGENPFAKESVREYVEKVSDGHGVEKKGRTDSPDNGKSPVSTAKGKPTTGATAHNILGSKSTEAGGKGGQGLVGNVKGEYTKGVEKNITGSAKTKMPQGNTLSKVAAGHGAERKGTSETGAYTKSPADRAQ
jgi:hypothetical protein